MNADPDVLYHYTDGAGLLGILGANRKPDERCFSLHLTHIQYLNDSAEFEYVRSRALEGLQAALTTADVPPQYLPKVPFHLQAKRFTSVEEEGVQAAFVTSFTAKGGDDIGQWRAYSKVGSRYAIGFSRVALDSIGTKRGLRLAGITYGDGPTKSKIEAFYAGPMKGLADALKAKEVLAAAGNEITAMEQRQSAVEMFEPTVKRYYREALVDLGAWCKDDAFTSEDEWRLATFAGSSHELELHYRSGDQFIAPYLKLEFDHSFPPPIVSITVGPATHKDLSVASIKRMLAQWGYEGTIAVTPSKIPFRD